MATYVLISLSRAILVVSPVAFHNLNKSLWMAASYGFIMFIFVTDTSLMLLGKS